ncbi:MAG TPA: SprT family zinc-dependent metalloprotease [Syntrophales bacterium]|nr:SprT family zinc-dependent metalloprotease [Syntrophales bacterium]
MELDYTVVRSRKRKRTISLNVKTDGTAVVRVPYRTPVSEIQRFCREKEEWLARKVGEIRERKKETRAKTFTRGEKFLFLGEPYPLTIETLTLMPEKLALHSGQFVVSGDETSQIRSIFIDWYRARAQEYIGTRVGHFSQLLGLAPKGIKISNARCRWGSCSQDDRLYFSWRIMMAPPAVIDYLVVHELAHMKEKNHSRSFWELVTDTIPGYRSDRTWLRDHGHILDI